jgi:hypothetical protein
MPCVEGMWSTKIHSSGNNNGWGSRRNEKLVFKGFRVAELMKSSEDGQAEVCTVGMHSHH